MKLYLMTSLLLLTGCLKAQTPFDGPFVIYKNDQICVTTIIKKNDLLIPETISSQRKQIVILSVSPEAHAEWTFTVALRDTLTDDQGNYSQSDKCLFVSDIEGEFVNFRKLLISAKVIDEQYNWLFGSNNLVIAGDIFDRGRDVVPELWLLYKLEGEAKAAGGKVITIIGNHDIMNLSGDHRYTDAKYFKDAWLMKTGIDSLFDEDTELGRWLRSKNVISKVGDILVMHGGLSPSVQQKHFSLEQLNTICRPWYGTSRKSIPDSLQLFFGNDALFWYRGYFIGPKANQNLIDETLDQYACKNIVVGHTIIKWNIASYYNGKVIGIDIDEHARQIQAALYNKGKWYVVFDDGILKPLVYNPTNDRVSEKDIL